MPQVKLLSVSTAIEFPNNVSFAVYECELPSNYVDEVVTTCGYPGFNPESSMYEVCNDALEDAQATSSGDIYYGDTIDYLVALANGRQFRFNSELLDPSNSEYALFYLIEQLRIINNCDVVLDL